MFPLPERLPALASVRVPSVEEFYRAHPPAAFVDSLRERHWSARVSRLLALASGGAVAAVAALVVVLVAPSAVQDLAGPGRGTGTGTGLGTGNTREALPAPEAAPGTSPGAAGLPEFGLAGAQRDKGLDRTGPRELPAAGPAFRMELLVPGVAAPVRDGDVLHAGDVVRFFYDSAAHDFAYLFSVDEWGRISRYYPETPGYSIPIVRGRNVPLPDGVMLDDYVGLERFFVLFSQRPIPFAQVQAAVAATHLAALAQGRGLESWTMLPIACPQGGVLIEKR